MAKRRVSERILSQTLAKRQELSCLQFGDLPNELMIGIFSSLNIKELNYCGQVSKRFRAIAVDEQECRKEELLRIIQDLQSFKCKKVPEPTGDQSKRYLCLNSVQSLCEKHTKKCPCGSMVNENPSEYIAKNLQNLPWMCKNYKWGCHEVKMGLPPKMVPKL